MSQLNDWIHFSGKVNWSKHNLSFKETLVFEVNNNNDLYSIVFDEFGSIKKADVSYTLFWGFIPIIVVTIFRLRKKEKN